MTIDTGIFRRIIEEHREAGIQAVADTMEETVRFGLFKRPYVESCARDRYDQTLDKIRLHPPV